MLKPSQAANSLFLLLDLHQVPSLITYFSPTRVKLTFPGHSHSAKRLKKEFWYSKPRRVPPWLKRNQGLGCCTRYDYNDAVRAHHLIKSPTSAQILSIFRNESLTATLAPFQLSWSSTDKQCKGRNCRLEVTQS